ncbi:MAG: histidine phosphatase family protein [Alphaproteobacteria bacterium]
MTETRWWWIRHAPVIQSENRIYGQTDLPADCSNAALFAALAETLPRDAVLVTSDLQRAVQTAAAIASAGLVLPKSILEPALREQHLGDWQGELRLEFAAKRGRDIRRFWLAPAEERAPNGESFADLVARVIPTVERLTRAHAGKDIVCVAHGGTIKAALAHALSLDYERALSISIANCSVTRLDHMLHEDPASAWRVAMVNWSPHL